MAGSNAFHAVTNTSAAGSRGIVNQVANSVSDRVRAALREYGYRRAERRLSALSDEMLRDVGLHRSEIGAAVRHGRAFGR